MPVGYGALSVYLSRSRTSQCILYNCILYLFRPRIYFATSSFQRDVNTEVWGVNTKLLDCNKWDVAFWISQRYGISHIRAPAEYYIIILIPPNLLRLHLINVILLSFTLIFYLSFSSTDAQGHSRSQLLWQLLSSQFGAQPFLKLHSYLAMSNLTLTNRKQKGRNRKVRFACIVGIFYPGQY